MQFEHKVQLAPTIYIYIYIFFSLFLTFLFTFYLSFSLSFATAEIGDYVVRKFWWIWFVFDGKTERKENKVKISVEVGETFNAYLNLILDNANNSIAWH